MTLAWNWRKGGAPAARIIVRHVVSTRDMVQALCLWAAIEDDDPLPDTMTAAEVEAIARRIYEQRGSGWTEDDWAKHIPEDHADWLTNWATGIVARAWPRQAKPTRASTP